MSEVKIDKDVPLPPKRCGLHHQKYPFATMEVGDSFFVPEYKPGKGGGALFHHWQKKLGHRYTSRKVEENGVVGLRIWRFV